MNPPLQKVNEFQLRVFFDERGQFVGITTANFVDFAGNKTGKAPEELVEQVLDQMARRALGQITIPLPPQTQACVFVQ
ncbi:MAG TPA: hypothetical protein G4N96_12005 [Chloroflexi bacterium]|nr:MAG: hypothetical protein B6243_00480 [Anaerolineaceae bacterium 4572_5.2]HEY85820.1 hypothetical protein [Chloroflexota bacterium]